ncbi:hypothetical protein FA95DRAFT_1567186 [Auriscalpium vulgare]|uniref:Uncharacterized protein n=1 Tax=Auriscalpium vulgare TaxID=40419 RepID=A0ACB8R768_9AGAM|nr:hypothetical protein FA95DRAFT_1567186 [Auriscalpium vulgare]
MEIEKPNTFLPELMEVMRHARRHDADLAEYFRTLCLYLFGTPVGRWGHRMPPPAPWVVRVKLYTEVPAPVTWTDASMVEIDEVDFPMEADGSVDLGMIKRWFGMVEVDICGPEDREFYEPPNPDRLSPLTLYTLSDEHNRLCLLEKPHIDNAGDRDPIMETWEHELMWRKRAFMHDPAWYGNRLLCICIVCWLSFSPEVWMLLATAFSTFKFAASLLYRY